MTSDHQAAATHDADDAALAPPPDGVNPALLDLNTAFTLTMILSALFIGAVVVFILL
jgi:hypothetical protein